MKPKFKITAKRLAKTEKIMSWLSVLFVVVVTIFFFIFTSYLGSIEDNTEQVPTMEEIFIK